MVSPFDQQLTPKIPEQASVDTTIPNQDAPMSIDTTAANIQTTPKLDMSTMSMQAFKALFSFEGSKTEPEIWQAFVEGETYKLRQEAAHKEAYEAAMKKQEVIAELAKNKMGPLTVDEYNSAVDPWRDPVQPEFIFEKKYADWYMGQLDRSTVDQPGSFMNIAKNQDPEMVQRVMMQGSSLLAKREIAQTLAQEYRARAQEQGWGGYLIDQAKYIVPGYARAKLGVFTAPAMLGSAQEQKSKELFRLPINQFGNSIRAYLDPIAEDNPSLAADMAEKIVHMTTDDVFLNNAFEVLDITGVGELSKLGFKAAVGINNGLMVRKAVRDAVKSSELIKEPSRAATAAAVGDVDEAVVQRATANMVGDVLEKNPEEKRAIDSLLSIFKLDRADIGFDPGRLATSEVNRIEGQYITSENNITRNLLNLARVIRVPLKDLSEQTIRAFKDSVRSTYPEIRHNILDISPPTAYNRVTNTFSYHIDIGKPNGGVWFERPAVEGYVKDILGVEGAEIVQQGAGFFVRINKNINETDNIFRDLLEKTKNNKNPKVGPIQAVLSRFRSPEDTMSFNERVNRGIATYAQSVLLKMANEEVKYIEDVAKGIVRKDIHGNSIPWYISRPKAIAEGIASTAAKLVGKEIFNKKKWADLKRTLEEARNMNDPITGEKGYYFRTPAELQDFYMRVFKRLPDFAETEAYFANRRLYHIDHAFRNLSMYRNIARLGGEYHAVYAMQKGQKVLSDYFPGIRRRDLPSGTDGMLVVRDILGKERFLTHATMDTKIAKELREGIKEGLFKVIEIFDPESRPLKKFSKAAGERRIRYVIVKNTESKPLDWNLVPRRSGGHFEYDYDHYIKQAKVRPERINAGRSQKPKFVHWYEGDATVMPIKLRSMGEAVAEKLNTARILMNRGRIDEAKQFFADQKIPIEWKEWESWFKPQMVDGELQAPRLSLEEPFHVVDRDRLIIDMDKRLEDRYTTKDGRTTLQDGTKQGSLARQFQVKFTGERDSYDLFSFADEGSKGNPLYKAVQAEFVDPITTMNRSVSRIINSHFMDDYKIYAVENWVRQASDYLKASESELKYAPFKFFQEEEFKSGPQSGEKWAEVMLLKSNREKIRQFIGVPSKTETFLKSIGQSLSDSLYRDFGLKRSAMVANWAIPAISDPFKYVRAMTFHEKLGLFSIPQIIVQNMTYATIFALSPRHAITGTYATMLHQWGRWTTNPAILKSLDQYATKMNMFGVKWKPGEWLEAREMLGKTGFSNVGREYANLDDMLSPKVVRNGAATFLDWGQMFFRGGEQNVRLGAWYTAFKEYRTKIPHGKIGNEELGGILQRADDLYTNMSRKSSSMLHTGPMSWTTQFLSYQLRLMELFFSKRIGETTLDRAKTRLRMFATYAALFGVPSGLGITGVPAGDYMRQYALDNGYIVGEKFWSTLFNEGIPSFLAAMATGGGDFQKGIYTNVPQRYGSPGFEQIRDAFRSDEPWWMILGGAPLSTLASTLEATDGFTSAMLSFMRDDDSQIPLRLEHFVQPFKEITSVNSAFRWWAAVNTGQWLSKKGMYLADVTSTQAGIMSLMGLQPQREVDDMFLKSMTLKNRDALEKKALSKFVSEFRKGISAQKDEQPENAKSYFQSAFAYLHIGGYPQEKFGQAISLASKGYEPIINSIDWRFYVKDVLDDRYGSLNTKNQGQRQDLMNAFETLHRIKQGVQ